MTVKSAGGSSFGAWKSPISAADVYADANGVGSLWLDQGRLHWLEARSDIGGRVSLRRLGASGDVQTLSADDMNLRSRVHEYGGGALLVAEGAAFFSNFADCGIYSLQSGNEPRRLTRNELLRYADMVLDGARGRLIAVREDHRDQTRAEPETTLVAIDVGAGGDGDILYSGSDFVAAPRISPDGKRLAWLSWNHPDMPWDVTRLNVAAFDAEGRLGEAQVIASDEQGSITQPLFGADGSLYFIADWSGWYNLYRWDGQRVQPLLEMAAEFAGPDWVFGLRNFGLLSPDQMIVSYTLNGFWYVGWLNLTTGELQTLEQRYTEVRDVVADDGEGAAWFVATSAERGQSIYRLDPGAGPASVYEVPSGELPAEYISAARPIKIPTGKVPASNRGEEEVHAFFYPPRNPDMAAPEGELPPLIVKIHGGPTAQASAGLDASIQFWTTRGFAVLDLNYRGSSGYGRAYRQLLNGNWGIIDVEDAVLAARYLGEEGLVDASRLAIRGGSAGGFTVLAALAFHDTFSAGTALYGVSDLTVLARETHKFESRYLDRLIGPWPEARAVYEARSPINAIDQINAPLLLLQGLDDNVVPPNQSEMVYKSLKKRGIPVGYIAFEGEGHGFRKPENRIRALEAELAFYGQVFGFERHDVAPLNLENIENLQTP